MKSHLVKGVRAVHARFHKVELLQSRSMFYEEKLDEFAASNKEPFLLFTFKNDLHTVKVRAITITKMKQFFYTFLRY